MKRLWYGVLGLGLIACGSFQVSAQDTKLPDGSVLRNLARKALGSPIPTSPIMQVGFDGKNGKEINQGRPVTVNFEAPTARPWALYGGVDALFLQPHFSSNPSITETTSRTTAVAAGPVLSTLTTTTNDFDYYWSVSPRVWIGFQSEDGVGFRGRWFHFDQRSREVSSTQTASGSVLAPNIDLSFTTASTPIGGLNNGQPVIFPATGAVIATGIVLTASSRLLVDTWDAEATFATQWGNCGFLISGGGRYLHTAQIYEATAPGMFVTIPGAPGVRTFTDASVLSRRTFTGGGPTVALDALHRLGQSHLSLFGSGRASLLYGCSRQSIETTRFQILETPTVSLQQTSISNVSNSGSRLLSVLELELGLEWTRPIGRGAEFVFRPAAVAQLYLDGGNASSNSGNFGLYGGMLSGGFRY